MKRIAILLLLVLGTFMSSCNNTNDIDLSLRLSMRVLQKSYEGTGFYMITEQHCMEMRCMQWRN